MNFYRYILLFRYSIYVAEGYVWTDITPTEQEKSHMNNNL